MQFALIQLGEYAHVLGASFLGALLFLGAWAGPGPAWLGPAWFLLKALAVFLLLTWIRWSFVRIRADQIMRVSWKLMLPATLLLLVGTADRHRAEGGQWLSGRAGHRRGCRGRDRRCARDAHHAEEFLPQAGHGPLPDGCAAMSRIGSAACWR